MQIPGARLLIILSLLWLSAASAGAPVAAQEVEATPEGTPAEATPEGTPVPLQFGIYPVGDFENRYFEVEMEAGDSMPLTAGIINAGGEPISLRTFATNAVNPPNGGFAAETEEDEPTGPTLWLDYPAQTFELVPGEDREIDFTVSVPEGTEPGQYVAALVVRTDVAIEVPGSEIFEQIIRGAVSVEITVPGPVTPGFELGTPMFSTDTAVTSLDIPVANTGNILVQPAGDLTVTTPDGAEILTSSVEMASVYGGRSTIIQISVPDQFQIGDYLVSVNLTDEATGATASIEDAPVTLAESEAEEAPTFVVDDASVTPNAEPVQYADVAATITNNGQAIPTANVMLNVQRDGQEVESYPLAQNQALPQGSTEFSQRYIPVDGWEEGAYTFQLVIASVSDGTETVLATIDVADEIVVP